MSNRLNRYQILLFLTVGLIGLQTSSGRAASLTSSGATTVFRDAKAVDVVKSTVESMGGVNSAGLVRSVTARGTMSSASPDGLMNESSFLWEDIFVGTPEFRREIEKSGSRTIFVSNHGAPLRSGKGGAKALSHHVALATPALYVPAIFLARVLGNPQYSLTIPKQDESSATVRRIEIALETDPPTHEVTLQDWYFDAVTKLPLKVEYRRINAHNARDYKWASAEFSDYRVVDGVTTPFAMKTQTKDIKDSTIFVLTAISFNALTSDSDFETR